MGKYADTHPPVENKLQVSIIAHAATKLCKLFLIISYLGATQTTVSLSSLVLIKLKAVSPLCK